MNDISQEINRIKKAIRRRQKDRKYLGLLSRLNELNNSKTDIRNEMDALKQIVSRVGDVKEQVKLKIKELENKIKNMPKENPFDFTDYLEKQKEDNEIDLGLFIELAEENKIIYNQTQ